jgi:hypothetical protein
MANPSPFAFHDGKPYLVVNFTLPPTDDLPSLQELLDGLLEHHSSTELLLLRPLTIEEARLLSRGVLEAEVEAWAQMVVTDDDRLRARSPRRRRKR